MLLSYAWESRWGANSKGDMAVKAMKLFEDVYGLEATEMFKESLLPVWKTGEEVAGVTAVV